MQLKRAPKLYKQTGTRTIGGFLNRPWENSYLPDRHYHELAVHSIWRSDFPGAVERPPPIGINFTGTGTGVERWFRGRTPGRC